MQTIFRSTPTSNFTILANDLVNSPLPSGAKNVLTYLISKPQNWQLRVTDISKQLALSTYAVRKALKQLRIAGYVFLERLRGGFTRWFIYDKPQTLGKLKTSAIPAKVPHVENKHIQSEYVLIRTEAEINKETTTPSLVLPPKQENIVVVDNSELIYPVELNPVQKKTAKHVIKKCNPELQQPVLFALAYAMAQNKVKSPVAYLNGLITRANNGTFEAIQAHSTTKQTTPLIPIYQGRIKPSKVDNDEYFRDLINRFGDKAVNIVNRTWPTANGKKS